MFDHSGCNSRCVWRHGRFPVSVGGSGADICWPSRRDRPWFIDNLAGGLTQLTSGPDTDASAEWSFDGKELTFQRNGSGVDGYAVMVMNANGSGLRDLSPSPGEDLLPTWTPGGQIVFSQVIQQPSPATMNLPVTALMVMNANGSERTPLVTPSPQSVFNLDASVSPDGKKIVFGCGPAFGSALQICEVNSDGTGFKFLTTVQSAVSSDPRWSPDGTKIAFSSNRNGGNVNVFTMNADGSDVTQLTNFVEPIEAGDAGWSTDGSSLAFEWDNGGQGQGNPSAPAAVWMMNSDGTDQHALNIPCSDTGCAPRFQPNSTFAPGASFTPGISSLSQIAGSLGMPITVPEPSTWTMMLLGFAGKLGRRYGVSPRKSELTQCSPPINALVAASSSRRLTPNKCALSHTNFEVLAHQNTLFWRGSRRAARRSCVPRVAQRFRLSSRTRRTVPSTARGNQLRDGRQTVSRRAHVGSSSSQLQVAARLAFLRAWSRTHPGQ